MKKRITFLYLLEAVLIFMTITMIFLLMGCAKEEQNSDGPTSAINVEKIQEEEENQEKEVQTPEETAAKVEESEEEIPKEETAADDGTSIGEKLQTEEKTYYGHWKVIDFLAPGITALSTEEMEGYINIQLTYAEDSFVVEDMELENPTYSETTITKEDFAESYNNQVTFDSLGISAASVTDVTVANSSGFGSMFFVADENTLYITLDGAFFKAVRQSEADMAAFEINEKGKAFLEYLCMTLEDFGGYAATDEAFWEDFLFYSYTNASLKNTEMVQIYREDLGFDETVVKVSLEEAERYAELVFGVEMPDIKPAVEDRKEGQASCYYQDGYYYIGASDFPDYEYNFVDCTVYDERFDTYAIVKYRMNFENVGGKSNAGTIEFIIYPEENENGFIIASKTTERTE